MEELVEIPASSAAFRAAITEPELEQSEESATLTVRGFTSRPEVQRPNRNGIYIFVNRRLVRDRLILHAIHEAYRNILPPTTFPATLLFLEMPYDEVDVNVHPKKTEVRFRRANFVHDFTRDVIRQALMSARSVASFATATAAGAATALTSSGGFGSLGGIGGANGEDAGLKPGTYNGEPPTAVPHAIIPPMSGAAMEEIGI